MDGEVTSQSPQTTTLFEEKGEPKRISTEVLPGAYQPNALPLGQTGSQPGAYTRNRLLAQRCRSIHREHVVPIKYLRSLPEPRRFRRVTCRPMLTLSACTLQRLALSGLMLAEFWHHALIGGGPRCEGRLPHCSSFCPSL